MIATALPLTILLFALAYLGLWLLIAFLAVSGLVQCQSARNAARRLGSLEDKQGAAEPSYKPLLVLLPVMFVTGGIAAWLALGRVQPVLLLAGLLIVGLALEELRESPRLMHLPVVLGLLEGLRTSEVQDVFVALQAVAETLPLGEVRAVVLEAVSLRSGGADPEQSAASLRGINPFLDELVVDLYNAGWQRGPTLASTLALLARRAAAEWSAAGHKRLLLERVRPLTHPIRAFLMGAMAAALYDGIQQSAPLETVRPILLAGAVVLVGLLGVVLHHVFTRPWLRRALATAALVTLLLLSFTIFQDVAPELTPALAATVGLSPTFTVTSPPLPMLTAPASPTPPLPPAWSPTGNPATGRPALSPTSHVATPAHATPTPTNNPPTATDQPTREPTDTPPPLPSDPTDTPPPPPENATNTPPPSPGGGNP